MDSILKCSSCGEEIKCSDSYDYMNKSFCSHCVDHLPESIQSKCIGPMDREDLKVKEK